MGDFAYLTVGKKCKFTSNKYQIPYSWCTIFDGSKDIHGVYELDIQSAKSKLYSTRMKLDDLEKHVSIYSDYNALWWKKHRKYILRSGNELKKDHAHQKYQSFLDQIEQIESEEGLSELIAMYELLSALEAAQPQQKVRLDLTDFYSYYDDFKDIFIDVKRHFTDISTTHNYLFTHILPSDDQFQIVLAKVQGLNEDEIIDKVLLPLFSKMGFYNVTRIAHHGPTESGLDIPLFYEFDRFNNRIYYGAQVKAIDIHTNSRREGHVESVSNQISQALDSKFIDQEDNEEKQIDRALLVTSKKVNDNARKILHHKFRNRTLTIIDGKKLAENIVRYDLVDKIIQTNK